ncbi:hypothetical protein Mp_8g03890 [Marchantia polymorpha subsp. ruderalis]|uniref:Uncharacterized protein n=1 Tax=Marchantia polymorpha TaxID=3197 RepID=A0A2R6XJK0_MARPO|nr:hypothetical protein MARPO_0012s0179 [Marchantia polymorpha]BBN18605.1 hypothetical protein Mp_8g03890 [Marchantia polymorpha subsp. ruderalis]|eukprot:PTQ46252.1 hypothetical protein MARPO_0012s0179 [Marchantia polymorpha]
MTCLYMRHVSLSYCSKPAPELRTWRRGDSSPRWLAYLTRRRDAEAPRSRVRRESEFEFELSSGRKEGTKGARRRDRFEFADEASRSRRSSSDL